MAATWCLRRETSLCKCTNTGALTSMTSFIDTHTSRKVRLYGAREGEWSGREYEQIRGIVSGGDVT